MNFSKIVYRLRHQVHRFAQQVSEELKKPTRRFVEQMLYGIQAAKDVVLAEIARELDESITIKKTIERLSRHLDKAHLPRHISDWVLAHASSRIRDDTLLLIDPTDLAKPHAKELEHLDQVRDGSTKEIVPGYPMCQVVACHVNRRRIIPVVHHVYSTRAPGFESENSVLLDIMDRVACATENRGIWVMDRGGDRRTLLHPLIDKGRRFIFRQRGDRHVLHGDRKLAVDSLSDGCAAHYKKKVTTQTSSGKKEYTLSFGARKVRLPDRHDRVLHVVVIRALADEPVLLLTNALRSRKKKDLWFIVKAYLKRWQIEESIRFVKQSYQLENVRVQSYKRLRTLVALTLLAAYFAAVYIGDSPRLAVLSGHVKRISRRIYEVAEFHYYALADGIERILARSTVGPVERIPEPMSPDPQRLLFAT